ncbi:DNA-binding transcriptional MerR regulator [Streptacidiphilus sp. MAP12-16]|uniref:MerR family transcriptional regulator n=1 Tax=Streptacidiphilus sp. MAP12-16 TaxID=3156300 RepID=UPI003513BDDB
MFSIGDFAKHGRVSIRMLRHYDDIGLLRPAYVDPASGYRFYEAGQLARLNRVIALKDLGFTLQHVQNILDDKVGVEELRGMLRLRRAELAAAREAAAARLAEVEARLRIIEREGHMPTDDVVVKQIPAVRLAELTGVAASFSPQDITPVIKPLYAQLIERLMAAGVTPVGPAIAYYESAEDDQVVVHAGMPVNIEADPSHDWSIVDLPGIDTAATVVHRGSMDDVMSSIQTLAKWIDANGHRSTGYNRELYLETPADEGAWVTELQEPITKAY